MNQENNKTASTKSVEEKLGNAVVQGAGIALGVGLVAGALGLLIAGPAGAVAGFKVGVLKGAALGTGSGLS